MNPEVQAALAPIHAAVNEYGQDVVAMLKRREPKTRNHTKTIDVAVIALLVGVLEKANCDCIPGCHACTRCDPSPHDEERYIATVCETHEQLAIWRSALEVQDGD